MAAWQNCQQDAADWIQKLARYEHQHHHHQCFGHVVLRLCFLGHHLTTSNNGVFNQWFSMFVVRVGQYFCSDSVIRHISVREFEQSFTLTPLVTTSRRL